MTIALSLDDLAPEQTDTTRRDRYGRYLVVPPDGGKAVGYTRATTISKACEDQHSLIAWKARTAAKGLTLRPELLKMIAVEEDRKRLDDLVEQAAQAGGATERRDEGTALHRALELHFTGQPVPPMFRADVDAVLATMDAHGLSVVAGMTERICVLDEHRIAGTFDLIVKHGATLYVADFKTGKSLDYSGLSFATQLAIYANADDLYTQGAAKDGSQDRRDPMPPVDKAVALVLHVQPGSNRCDIHDVDIDYGRRALDLAIEVRTARTKGRSLITPRTSAGTAAAPTATTGAGASSPPAPVMSPQRAHVLERIKALKAIRADLPALVASRWPAGVPMPQDKGIWSRADLDAIDKVLSDVERAVEAPLTPPLRDDAPPQGWVAAATTAAPVEAPAPRTFNEGATLDDATVDAMLATLGALAPVEKAWIVERLTEARDAGVPVSLRAQRSMRAFEITRALIAWADVDDETLARLGLVHVLGDDRVQPGYPLGAVIGALSIDEAVAFAEVPARLDAGTLVYVADAQGERLEVAE